MSSALLASREYVPEVSTSMYTALRWLRGSLQPLAASASVESRNLRRSMASPLGVRTLGVVQIERAGTAGAAPAFGAARAFHQALGKERDDDRDVIQANQQPRRLPRGSPGDTQQQRERAHQRDKRHAAHRARGVDQRLERDGDEGEREGQDEA